MAKVVTRLSSEQSSDNEEITKLFPKCRPRTADSDVNQNKVLVDAKNESRTLSEDCIAYGDKLNDNYQDACVLTSKFVEGSSIYVSRNREESRDAMMNDDSAEDTTVVSGYECGDMSSDNNCLSVNSNEPCCDNSIVYNTDLDIGYHLGSQQEIAVRESRIEIAGGREIFCKSRSKPSKKRHSDEVVYHPPDYYDISPEEVKRHSGEVHEDKFVQYVYGLQQQTRGPRFDSKGDASNAKSQTEVKLSKSCVQKQGGRSRNGSYSRRATKAVSCMTDNMKEHKLSLGHLVYETPVHNAEIVYDDIGELVNQNSSNDADIEQKVNSGSSVRLASDKSFGLQETHLIGSSTGQSSPEPRKSVCNTSPSPFEPYVLEGTKLVQSHSKMKHADNPSVDEVSAVSECPSPEKQTYARVIGNVPIAEYEGSPRRYGPRPGYPQRLGIEGPPSLSATSPTEESYIQNDEAIKNDINCKSSSADFHKQGQNGFNIYATVKNQHYKNAKKLDGDCYSLNDNLSSDLESGTANKFLSCEINENDFSELDYKLYRMSSGNSYVGQRLAQSSDGVCEDSPKRLEGRYINDLTADVKEKLDDQQETTSEVSIYLPNEHELMLLHERVHQHTLQVEMVENDRESLSTFPGTEDLGETEIGEHVDNTKNFTLSPETTDCDSNEVESEMSFEGSLNSSGHLLSSMPILEDGLSSGHSSEGEERLAIHPCGEEMDQNEVWQSGKKTVNDSNPTLLLMKKQINEIEQEIAKRVQKSDHSQKIKVEEYLRKHAVPHQFHLPEVELGYFDTFDSSGQDIPDSANNSDHDRSCQCSPELSNNKRESVSDVIREIKQAIQHSKNIHLKNTQSESSENVNQPIWVPRLSQPKTRLLEDGTEVRSSRPPDEEECDTDQETDRLLGAQRSESFLDDKDKDASGKKKGSSKEVLIHEPAVLIEGVLFRARYLGSTQLVCEGQPTKATRMMQAEEAVSRIKAPEGETQPSTEVDLFISTEKIMVLNTDLKEIMMDHALRTISYIADIGDLVVLMARRRMLSPDDAADPKHKHTPKMICHVFESEEAQFIAQSIGQAFQVAYMEFLKANGIEDSSFVKEMDYQEVLNSQEIFGNELEMFAKKDRQKEVIVPKQKGEILGMVIVESGWGSMLPTVVIANMAQSGPAARCGQLNIGDQIIAINGVSLVGLPLSTCQNYIKNTKTQTVVKLTVVPCAPVVEVKIKRPDTKYQLGFSVQNGVICSLLRGGIAERGGVRVGHRIIEINGQSVVAVPHEKIVNLLATSVGEINMKTMPTSMFRLLTGQESPMYI